MDQKQLDLNAPLLSVRRLSLVSSNLERENATPNGKSRPNRQHSLPLYKSDWEPEQEVTEPAAVPFLWEHIPGKPKQGSKKPLPEKPSNSPRIIPPGKLLDTIKKISEDEDESNYNFFSPQMIASPLNEEREREEDMYADALEKLSPSESFSWNCSANSLNGFDNQSFSSDQETRDYLMSRFLPAAKSMIVETPQHVSKKLPAVTEVTEHPKLVKKVYSGELRPLLEQYRSGTLYEQYRHGVESGEEKTEEFDGMEKKSSKACGFFPRLCVKNSLCVLNQLSVSKSKIQTKSPARFPSTSHIPRLARTSYSGPLTPSLEKQTMDAVYRKRSVLRSKEVHRIKPNNQFMTDGSCLYNNWEKSWGGRVSSYRNESPQSPFRDGARFLGMPKQVQNFEAKNYSSSVNRNSDEGSNSVSTIDVKTLYIDWVDKVETPRKFVPLKAEGYSDDIKSKSLGKLDTGMPRNEGVILHHEVKKELCSKVEPNENLPYPLGLPLPKSPSESWLWHKPSMRNQSPKKHSPKSPMNGGAKWETIVKTSNVHHDHVRYSKELLRVSQHSDT